MARVLVTGGAGFVGSHLCDRLLHLGHEVFSLDSLQTGSKANIAHLTELSIFHDLRHDVENPFNLDGIEQIYHLACPASPVHYQADPIRTMRTSVLGAINMLELAQANKARIVFASTSEVYGDPEVHPQVESYRGSVNPIGIRACYDEGKRAAETLAMDYHRTRGVDVGIARIFNTYGPRMAFDDGRVVSNFLIQAMRKEPLTIYGDGGQTRSFCYVSDLVQGLIALMDSEGFTGPVNLGNDAEFNILELAEKVLAKFGSAEGAGIARLPLPSDDPTRRKPDISLARKVLGWSPKVALDDGLALTGADFKARMQAEAEASQ